MHKSVMRLFGNRVQVRFVQSFCRNNYSAYKAARIFTKMYQPQYPQRVDIKENECKCSVQKRNTGN